MKAVRTFTVVPTLPQPLEPLRELAYNLRWSWDHDTIALFRRLDHELWESTEHNPVAMLRAIDQNRLDQAAVDETFLAHLARVHQDLQEYMNSESTWFDRVESEIESASRPLIAYFSAEFGLTECLSIFAGGLGVLAGDHLKSASDLGIPLVGVGLMYQRGYFRQYLDATGHQQERFWYNDFEQLPLILERHPDGTPIYVNVPFPGRDVMAQVWRVQIGRVSAYLLDSHLPENQPADREITSRLYGGGSDMRIKQEIMLGIGGYRALKAVGLDPAVYHLNEGHASFLAVERIRHLMLEQGISFDQAREVTAASTVFTSHTPVAAGHDRFAPAMIEHYFAEYWNELGISREMFLGLGRENPADEDEYFTMTVLALQLAEHRNGVSMLHGQITREMWQAIWPGVPVDEIPIRHVTNGVHLPSWISEEMAALYDTYLGTQWRDDPGNRSVWAGVSNIPAQELWRTHELRRERLILFARSRVRQQVQRRGAGRAELNAVEQFLDPNALTIGFARRFATYKRAALLLRDLDRLDRIVNHPDHPVQFIFAGKAHPHDEGGKELVHQVASLLDDDRFRGKLVFLEDYDMAIARFMVQGVDVWLNTPRRPWEASGTSGMKSVANGGLNLSILDGWWDEAWRAHQDDEGPPIGWAIGDGSIYEDPNYADEVDAESLYELLENEVVPTFYTRDDENIPYRWLERVRQSLGNLCWFYNTHRMLREYTDDYYLPANRQFIRVTGENLQEARERACWKSRVTEHWDQIQIEAADQELPETIGAGDQVSLQAHVNLGELKSEDVDVQVYLGTVDHDGNISNPVAESMRLSQTNDNGWHVYTTDGVKLRNGGRYGYTFRILPRSDSLVTPYVPGLITWAHDVT